MISVLVDDSPASRDVQDFWVLGTYRPALRNALASAYLTWVLVVLALDELVVLTRGRCEVVWCAVVEVVAGGYRLVFWNGCM